MTFPLIASMPLFLMAQTFTLVVTEKDGKKTQIDTDNIATMEFVEINETPGIVNMPVLKGGEVTANSVKAVMTAEAGDYRIGIVPRDGFKTDAELISYVNSNPAAQRMEIGGGEREVTFSGLANDKYYVIVAFDANSTDKAAKYFVSTSTSTVAGYSGSVFPYGVSTSGGFYDVDKKGNISQYGSGWTLDNDFCWACSCAGVIAWWLDDYRSKTGEDYPLTTGVVPAQSACYSTPIMDVFVNAYNHNAGSPDGIPWFVEGTDINGTVNGGTQQFKESYPHWRGGFFGATHEEYQNEFAVINPEAHYSYDDPKDYQYTFSVGRSFPQGCDQATAIKVFSETTLAALREGAAYLGFGGNHALSLWGADYIVLSDGTPQITHLYIAENDVNPANTQNGLERCAIKYEYDSKYGRQKYVAFMTTPIRGADTIVHTVHMRGWQPK